MNDLIRIGVVGSRSFNDYELLKRMLDAYKGMVSLIVSGGAAGADLMAEKWALENNVKTWDGLSRGTEHTINLTKKTDKALFVYYFNKVI